MREGAFHLTTMDELARHAGVSRAIATLHMLTSLESYRELRREGALSERQARDTIAALARTLLAS